MADIDAYLQAILKAIYGREVRGSIHDAIEAINNEVVAAKGEMDDFVQGNLDDTLTSATLPAQGKAAGDAINGSDLSVCDLAGSLSETNVELYAKTAMIDGYYPTLSETASKGPGALYPNEAASASNFVLLKPFRKLTFYPGESGTHNLCYYDKNKKFVYGEKLSLVAGVPYECNIPYSTHPDICFARYAILIVEKETFSLVGESKGLTVSGLTKSSGAVNIECDFSDGNPLNANSSLAIETFWMTDYSQMQEVAGKELKTIGITAAEEGQTITVRGYDGTISPTLDLVGIKQAAITANAEGYDLFRITNTTAGFSTYRLDGTDNRVYIFAESLKCPPTIGITKEGDTGKFRYFNSEVAATEMYFTHKNMTQNQMRASRLGIVLEYEEPNGIHISIDLSNGEKKTVILTQKDIVNIIGEQKSRFSQMKMNCLGDSITYGYIPDSGAQMANPYPSILKNILGLKECRNYGISGSTLAVNRGNYSPMCLRFTEMDTDADIVLLFGGTNDYGRTVYTPDLGTINDNVTSSVYGALNILAEGLITLYPKALIFFCTPLKRADKTGPNAAGYTLEDVADAIRNVAHKYGIPVLDFNYKGGFYIDNSTFRALYGGNDKLHPNEAFDREHLAPMIAGFINSIL